MDLSSLYKTLSWHYNQRDRQPNESVGLFITLPTELAHQYPKEGKEGEDTSPPHITAFYIGEVPAQFEKPMVDVLKLVCENFRKFKIKIKKPKTFENDKGQIIYHSPISSAKLVSFNETLQKAFQYKQLPYSRKWPEFKPHITICYADNEEELKQYSHIQPMGEFMVENVWCWRFFGTLSL